MNIDKKEFVLPAKNSLQIEEKLQGVTAESGGEFVLPDYMPKVQRILRLCAVATPPSRYMSTKDAQFSGNVLHSLVYIGEDGEISATVLPSKYEVSVALPADVYDIVATVEIDNLTYRLTAPRKLNIRTRLRINPCAFSTLDIEDCCTNSSSEIQKLYGEIDTVKTTVLKVPEITVSDSLKTTVSDNTNLLWCGASAAVSDVKTMDGGVSVRGEVIAKVLLAEDNEPKFYTKRIPFDEFVDGEITKNTFAIATASVVSTEASMDNSGEVLIDAVVAINVTADTAEKMPVLKDLFSTEGEGRVEYSDITSVKNLLSLSGVYDVNASVHRDGDFTVVDTSGTAALDEIVMTDGKPVANGRCMLNLICKNEEGGIYSSEYTVPFKIVLDGDIPDGADILSNASLLSARSRLEGENILFDMDIALSMRVMEKTLEKTVSKADFTDVKRYEKSKYPMSIVYANGESLWNLAKKYHISPETLAKINMIEIDKEDYINPEKIEKSRSLMLEF
ncbi:MAG: LysM peptidoglycan-binding domain-containing protein [Clostridia bacterium]|nr:LysM peptidoglycan-binding domain-containing protein [Clostridia bacterium]